MSPLLRTLRRRSTDLGLLTYRDEALLALTSMVASGCAPCDALLAASVQSTAGGPPSNRIPWSGVIGVEGEVTGDGRLIERNALRWENLPLPLRYVSTDVGGHDGAVVVGTIETIARGGNGSILGTGFLDGDSPVGQEAIRQLDEHLTDGVSMDLDDVSFEVRIKAELLEDGSLMDVMFLATDTTPAAPQPGEPVGPEVDADGRITVMEMGADDEVRVTTSGRIRAATIVAIPAFATAKIALTATPTTTAPIAAPAATLAGAPPFPPKKDAPAKGKDAPAKGKDAAPADAPATGDAPPAAPVEGDMGTCTVQGCDNPATTEVPMADNPDVVEMMCDQHADEYMPSAAPEAIVASAIPVAPPALWFSNPRLTGPTPLRVADDGRVMGHLAAWHTCHTGHGPNGGSCVMAPKSQTGYAYFSTGTVISAEGAEIAVGRITLDTRHAGPMLSAASATSHYEDTGVAVADVCAGEDEHGIWVAGALRPGTTPEQIRALRSAPLSGDWRRIGSNLELVAALAVNVPGFPIPRPSGLVASGVVKTMVATGLVPPRTVRRPGTPGALSMDDLRYLKRLADRERAEEQRARISPLRPDEDVAARVRAYAQRRRVERMRDHLSTMSTSKES